MHNQSKNRVIVVTIPKAGTYLTFELIKRMGLQETFLHIQYDERATGVYDFRTAPHQIKHSEKKNYFAPMLLDEALAKINIGEFAVGHLPPLPAVKQILRLTNSYKIIFLVRNLRDCLISHMRYMIKTGEINEQNHPWCNISDAQEKFKQYLLRYAATVGPLTHMKLIASWEYDILTPYKGMSLLKIRFEDLTSSDEQAATATIHKLAEFLDITTPPDPVMTLRAALDSPSLTKSDGLTARDKYWSPFAEAWFQDHICDDQGNNLNKMMGYDD